MVIERERERELQLTSCLECLARRRYTMESTGTLPNWWVWSPDETPPTELRSTADLTHFQS